MARCERGYLCEVCDDEVAEITDSDLYLSYIVGLVDSRALLARPERHVRCNPVQAQFIVDERFPPMTVEGPFDKRKLDADYVRSQEELVTRGWQRLQEVAGLGIAISEYPLPEVRRTRSGEPGA
jgi:hypothetical protein